MRVGHLIFVVLGVCACGGQEMSPTTGAAGEGAGAGIDSMGPIAGNESMGGASGGGTITSESGTGDPCPGANAQIIFLCECSRPGLLGLAQQCCFGCYEDSVGLSDCPSPDLGDPNGGLGFVAPGRACEWIPHESAATAPT